MATPEVLLLRVLRTFVRFSGTVGYAAIWVITFVVAYDVTVRYLGFPTIWAMEVSAYFMLGVAVLGAGDTLLEDGHIEIRLFVDRLPSRLAVYVQLAALAIGMCFIVLLVFGAIELVHTSVRYELRSPTLLQVPLFYPQSVLVWGTVALAVAFGLRVLDLARSLRRPVSPD